MGIAHRETADIKTKQRKPMACTVQIVNKLQ